MFYTSYDPHGVIFKLNVSQTFNEKIKDINSDISRARKVLATEMSETSAQVNITFHKLTWKCTSVVLSTLVTFLSTIHTN